VEKERLENEKFTRILGIITLLSGILSTLTTYAAISIAYNTGYWDGPNITENMLGAVVLLVCSASFLNYRPKTLRQPQYESTEP
jgi:hypothetical protein